MVTTISPRDIGGDLGRSIGSGFGDAMKMLSQRQMRVSAIDDLQKNLQEKYYEDETDPITDKTTRVRRKDIDPLELTMDLVRGTESIPGGAQSIMENIAPILMKQMQSSAAVKGAYGEPGGDAPAQNVVGGNIESEEAIEWDENIPIGMREKLTNLHNMSNSTREKYDQMPEGLMAAQPKFGEDPPAYDVQTLQEMANSSSAMYKAGLSPGEIYQANQQKQQQALQAYQSQRQGYEDKVRDFALERGLEDEQVNFLSGPDQQGGRVGNWLADNKIENSQFWHDQAYKQFQKEKIRDPNRSDQKIWTDSKAHLDNLKNLEARGRGNGGKPLLSGVRHGAAKESYRTARNFAESFYKMAGNTPESRERVKTILANNGWDKDYVMSIAQPPSKGLEKWFKDQPVLPHSAGGAQGSFSSGGSSGAANKIARERRDGFEKIMENVGQLVGSEEGATAMLGTTDSVHLLRNRLVREKGLNTQEATSVINKMAEQGFLSAPQQAEIPDLNQRVKIMPMYDIFTEAVER